MLTYRGFDDGGHDAAWHDEPRDGGVLLLRAKVGDGPWREIGRFVPKGEDVFAVVLRAYEEAYLEGEKPVMANPREQGGHDG